MTEIVAYQEHHFADVDQLWRAVFPEDPPRNQAAAAIPKKLAMEDGLFFVAEDPDGNVIGTAMAIPSGHRGWLYSVAVDPAMRRQAIGQALIETAIEALRNLGCNKVNLQIRAGNEKVAAFYRSLGFEVEPRTSMGRSI